MEGVRYTPRIQDMVWSYSRIKLFEDCPYRWYLRYIQKRKKKNLFFSDFGSFMHHLLELYYRGEKTREQLCDMYLLEFRANVIGRAPNAKLFEGYFKSGLQYLRKLQPFPYRTLAVEKKVNFTVNGIPFVGYIDFIGELDGCLYVVDHKSRTLKPRSSRKKPTKSDADLDSYLKQLYLYSAAIEQEYGKMPKSLCLNCFRVPVWIEEAFRKDAYEDAKRWAAEKVAEITAEKDFRPNMEYFQCNHLCEMCDHCEYYRLTQEKRW